MNKNYRVMFDNGTEINVEAKNEKRAFYVAKKKLCKAFAEEKEKQWLDSMASQFPDNARVEQI